MSMSHEYAVSAAALAPSVEMEPLVKNPAENRLLQLIEREQLPGDVRQTLAGALTGDLTAQQLLFQAMIDTWPRLQKNLTEVKRAVRRAPWQISPYKRRRQDEAEPEAKKRAELLEDIFWETEPKAELIESSAEDMIGELVYGYYTGVHVVETYWHHSEEGHIKPEGYKSVPARFYGFPPMSDDSEQDRLMFNRDGGFSGYDYENFPEHHFLLSINQGHPGHVSVAAPLRCLTGYWLAANFGLKWLLNFSQLFGIPFRWAEYADNTVKEKVSSMLQSIGSAGWGAFPKGTKINFEDVKQNATTLPQKVLVEMADKQADIFILGQTLTTDVGDSGSRALGDVHNSVKQEMIEGVCDHVEDILNRQHVPSIIELNYGDRKHLPRFDAAFEKEQNEKEMAERDQIIIQSGFPISKKQFRERHKLLEPESKEDTFTASARPHGVQGDPATGDQEPIETKGEKKLEAARAETMTVETLSESVLEGLTGVTMEWLAPVKPIFLRIGALAMSETVSDEDFIKALSDAQKELPELFEVLNTDALRTAFEDAIGTAMVAGSADRYLIL